MEPINAVKPAELLTSQSDRLISVDALRGFVMFWIVGGDSLAKALAPFVKNSALMRTLSEQMTHVEWEGFRFYDAIFPAFLFLVGISIVLSLDKLVASLGRAATIRRITTRSIVLYLIGILYSGGLARPWPDVALVGVLQRIAICYLLAAVMQVLLPKVGIVVAAIVLLGGYGLMLCYLPYPELDLKHATVGKKGTQADAIPIEDFLSKSSQSTYGHFEEGRNLTNYVDFRWLPGKKRNLYYTNEGLLSTISALVTTLFGIMAGWVMTAQQTMIIKSLRLISFGMIGIALGIYLEFWIPIIKRIWTPSYCLVASGCASVALGLFALAIDVGQYRKWCLPFLWIGSNAITLYLFVNVVDCEELAKRFVGGNVAAWFDASIYPGIGSFFITIVALSLPLLLARSLYQRKIFIRI